MLKDALQHVPRTLNEIPVQQWLKNRAFTALLVIGLLTLITLDQLLVNTYQRDHSYQQTLFAQKLEAQLVSSINEHIAALLSINVVYQNFVDITAYDFQQYGQSIGAHLSGFNLLLFIDPNFKVKQLYPSTPQNASLYGMSVKNNAQLMKILEQSKSTQKETTSGLIPFLDRKKTLLAVLPIYRNRREFLGYAVGEIALNEILEPISTRDQHITFHDYMFQLIDPDNQPYFDGINFTLDPDRQSRQKNVTVLPFQITGKQWHLLIKPASPVNWLLLERLGLWFVGLGILTVMLILIVRNSRHKSALNAAQQQFETIFQSSPDGILLLDNKLHPQLANPTVTRWTQKSIAEIRQETFFDVFECQCPHLEKCRELSFLLCTSDSFKEELPETLEVDLVHRSKNAPLRMRFNAARITRQQRQAVDDGFICLLGDVSASKELEREKETYVATLTHDLKTPLLAQEMVLDSLLSGSTGQITPTQKKLLEASRQSVNDLLDMVNDSLLFYKIESSRLTIHQSPYNLKALIKEVIDTLNPLAQSRHLKIELVAAEGLPEALIDPPQMRRVLQNILSNAISYARRESSIRIHIRQENRERLLIEISNEGKGIQQEDLTRIFEKYYSLSRKFKQIGTGLGLYISRRIVEMHGGKVWATSEIDKETVFTISLPYPEQIELNGPTAATGNSA